MRIGSMISARIAVVLLAGWMVAPPGAVASRPKVEQKPVESVQVYRADIGKTRLGWVGRKVGGKHVGALKLKSGQLLVADGRIVGGSFEMAMNTIVNLDLEDAAYNKKLVTHLKSDDFFSVEKYPVSRLVVEDVSPLSAPKPGERNHRVKGTLTIKGITRPIAFPAHVAIQGDMLRAVADITLDRTKWNIRYGSGKFFKGLGDKLIDDDFVIQLTLVARK